MKRILCLLAAICLLAAALPLPQNAARADEKYYITVDITNQIVTVYNNGNTSDSGIVRQMICSTGKSGTPTPTGTFSLPSKTYAQERTEWYYFSEYNCYAKWATRIYKGILFHSVLYTAAKKGPTKASKNALGSQASHGCVRLRVEDAQWIAQNCPAGTKCRIYHSGAKNEDLRKRLKNQSFYAGSQSYDSFMGRPEGSSGQAPVVKINLSRGKKGELVGQLQSRLRALGYYDGAVDSKFGKGTKAAVQAFQAAVGVKKTGKVNNDLWNSIFADNAPVSSIATQSEGWQGPCVAALQQALATLKMFSGAVDGNYGADTTAAVSRFQQCYNLPVTGKADSAMQQVAAQKSAEVKAQFGDAAYELVTSEVPATLATITAKRSANLRSAPKKGKKLAKLARGTQVKVLADGTKWVQVQYNGIAGYVDRKYLNIFAGTEVAVSFQLVPQEPAPSLPGVEEPVVLALPAEAAETAELAEGLIADAPEAVEGTAPSTTLPESTSETVEGTVPATAVQETTPETVEETAPTTAELAVAKTVEANEAPAAAVTAEANAEPVVEEAAEGNAETAAETPVEPAAAPVIEPAAASEAETAPLPEAEVAPLAETEPVAEPEAETAPLPKYAVALAGGAALYAQPDAAEPLATLAEGEALEVAEVADGWIAVAYNGETAWVAAAQVALTDALPEPVEAQTSVEEEAAAEPVAEVVEPGTEAIEPGTEPAEPAAEPAAEADGNGLDIEPEAPVSEEAGEETLTPAA